MANNGKEGNMSDLIIDYYLGAYGKTIYIKVEKNDGMSFLKDLFHHLSTKHNMEYVLSDNYGVHITGVQDVVLKNTGQQMRVSKIDGKEIILWNQNPDDWYHCEGLIDGLINSRKKGHQYLSYEGQKIIVEVVKDYADKE